MQGGSLGKEEVADELKMGGCVHVPCMSGGCLSWVCGVSASEVSVRCGVSVSEAASRRCWVRAWGRDLVTCAFQDCGGPSNSPHNVHVVTVKPCEQVGGHASRLKGAE